MAWIPGDVPKMTEGREADDGGGKWPTMGASPQSPSNDGKRKYAMIHLNVGSVRNC